MNVVTRSYSNLRDGAQLSESVLTSIHVQKSGISVLGTLQLDDDARGTEGQPLVVSGLTMRDGIEHDVVFVADMSNNVYAFDAQNFQRLWKQHVGRPIAVDKKLDMWGINQTWGILSTPVINPATKTIYVVSLSSADGTIGRGTYRLHTLSLVDGSDQAPPLTLDNATYTALGKKFRFGSVARKQRAALLFDSRNGHDTVFIPFGSFAESASTNQGWIVAVDVTGLKPTIAASWVTAVKNPGAGIWMGGQGLSMDADGYLYGMTGNGGFDPPTDVGECFFKLKYTPGNPAVLECVDWWSPYSDAGRLGQDPTLPVPRAAMTTAMSMAGMDMSDMDMDPEHVPNNAMNAMMEAMAAPTSNQNKIGDEDLGSGGPLLLPASLTGFDKSAIVGAGKDGIAYVVDMNNMGKTMNEDFASGKTDANFDKLLSPPYNFTDYLGGFDSRATPMSIPGAYNGYTHHQHSTPVCYKSPDHGFMLFTQGENGPVRVFRLNADFTLTYLASGAEIASGVMPPPGGMPGGMMTLSASGNTPDTAILWVLMPLSGDANKHVVQGRLVAYGANWLAPGGNLIKIWDSADWNVVFQHNKFNVPTVANGRVYVPSYDGRVLVLG